MRFRVGRDRRRDDDWARVRETIDLADIVTRCLGSAPGRRGSNGGRLWWLCPFHDDRNPSLSVRAEDRRWRCFGCGASGDAVDFVRGLNPGMSFPEIKAFLIGNGPIANQANQANRRILPLRREPEPARFAPLPERVSISTGTRLDSRSLLRRRRTARGPINRSRRLWPKTSSPG